MSQLIPLALLAPVLLLATALFAKVRFGGQPGFSGRLSEYAALAALFLSVGGLAQLLTFGSWQFALSGGPFALAIRLDALSATMTMLVAFIGWIVLRYSRTYLEGEPRESSFHGLMLATLAAVLFLVQAGSLPVLVIGFIGLGFGLRRLLLFYPERAEARRAATKFAIVWHAGDAALILSSILFITAYGTTDLGALAQAVKPELTFTQHLAIVFLVVAAVLKTATFPLHGWLTEVMEAPTPVSALLHAGIINAGGFLLIRTAELVQASPGSMSVLVALGGLTALFGAVVMLTQSAVKTALAWSTISQMGFMLLQCGLGLWPLALLHIVAHSLYKAHAFLSSGEAIVAVAGLRKPGPIAVPSMTNVAKSFAIALVLYGALSLVFALIAGPKSPQVLAIGTILIFGVSYLVAQGLADEAPAELTYRTSVLATIVALAYFAFQQTSYLVWGSLLPAAPDPGTLEWALITLAVLSFGLVAFAQALFPLWTHHPSTAGLRVHVANGLYLNALLDRFVGGYQVTKFK
ncbi:proton-conducting transporter membrane subunit [Roseibium porphyridii]|uniref:Probable inorganic carbon transporter subunit DabB n=1 Tax=Roseibium porphyridii TaxID=2866279 RepID=A0ABY8FBK0_9HYPH|nr:proton-conducting transporter membrane subunit [Roseibium sp. KMA01]WFE91562.1 proton-conducting transporter membrane subunit [Roseibium sp. KMA01]